MMLLVWAQGGAEAVGAFIYCGYLTEASADDAAVNSHDSG